MVVFEALSGVPEIKNVVALNSNPVGRFVIETEVASSASIWNCENSFTDQFENAEEVITGTWGL